MVEGTGLENRNTGNRIRGSNPLASALGLKSSVPEAHLPRAENLTYFVPTKLSKFHFNSLGPPVVLKWARLETLISQYELQSDYF